VIFHSTAGAPDWFNDELRARLLSSLQAQGRVNILIAGKSGVGKSTLVNAIFGQELAAVGQGRPVTRGLSEVSVTGQPITLIDSEGFELDRFDAIREGQEAYIQERQAKPDPHDHIHLAWVCFAEGARRIEEVESRYVAFLAGHMPVIAVITKATADQGFRDTVAQLVPEVREIIRVRSITETMDEGLVLPTKGLDQLIQATCGLIPEAHRLAFASCQRLDLNLKAAQARAEVDACWFWDLASEEKFLKAILRIHLIFGVGSIERDSETAEDERTWLHWLIWLLQPGWGGVGQVGFEAVSGFVNKQTMFAYIDVLHDRLVANPDEQPGPEELARLLLLAKSRAIVIPTFGI
jgi:GTP-binding protein EngB required for normal cell division